MEAPRGAFVVKEGSMVFSKLEIFTLALAVCFVCFLLWGAGWLN